MKFHIQSKNAEFRPTKGDASPEKKQQQRDFFALFAYLSLLVKRKWPVNLESENALRWV